MTRRLVLVVLVVLVAAGAAALAAAQLGGDDDPSSARTDAAASLSDSQRTAEIWAVGDAATGGDAPRRVADLVARNKPDRFLYLGDVYEEGTPEEFRRHYEPLYGRLKRITAPTPGNHEWPNHEEGYDPYWRKANPALPRDRRWYTFKIAGWEIVVLNSEEDHDPGSAQVRWLERQLRERGTCRIAVWHRPYVSAGRHGDQEDLAPLWNAVSRHAVLVLGGNDHNMQHFKPQGGLAQLVSGAGGRHLYSSNENDSRLVWDEDDEFGALRLDLRRGLVRFRFVKDDGTTLHRGRARCRPLRG